MDGRQIGFGAYLSSFVLATCLLTEGVVSQSQGLGCLTGDCLSGDVDADDYDRVHTGDNEGDWFGLDIAGIGDILAFPNDEAVIISGLFDGDPNDGRVYVVHRNSFDPFFYEIPFGNHGKSCASAGDLDNDGVNDFIVGGGNHQGLFRGHRRRNRVLRERRAKREVWDNGGWRWRH